MTTEHDRRIARNTLFLYLRMFITMGVSIYTSRVILTVLGVEDYGIYNVVGGLVLMLGFMNATMSGTTQRFLNYEMGRREAGRLSETFAATWKIHCWLAAVLVIIGETLGLWLVNHYLVFAPERLYAANVVFQLSLVGAVLSVLAVPFSGAMFAHERMGIFAIIQLSASLAKLGIALLLVFVKDTDHLITFTALMVLVQLMQLVWFASYSVSRFSECGFSFKAPSSLVKKLLKYSGADLTGSTFCIVGTQGILVVINRIGGTVLNAAAGVATTVSGALNQFGQTIIMAFRPQIIAEYAAGNYPRMTTLMANCARYSVLLYGVFALPVFLEMDYILEIWLKVVPAHAASFCRIVLISSAIALCNQTLNAGMHATGDILKFSISTGATYMINLPIIYVLMKVTGNPDWAYLVPVAQLLFNFGLIEIMLHNRLRQFSPAVFFLRGLAAPSAMICAAGVVAWLVSTSITPGFLRLTVCCLLTTAVLCSGSWTFLLNAEMRTEVKTKILQKLHGGH